MRNLFERSFIDTFKAVIEAMTDVESSAVAIVSCENKLLTWT